MKKENNSGRSMVEMLAVLALAGIITIGGLAGFGTAIKKMKANDITEVIALASAYALTHNVTITKRDIDKAIEGASPDCIDDITAEADGTVVVTFLEGCDEVKGLVGTSFPQCRWELGENGKGTYNPHMQLENGECKSNN